MDRINVIGSHVRASDGTTKRTITQMATSANPHIKVVPAGKKHFATNPWERLSRWEGDGAPSPAITIPAAFAERVKHVGNLDALAQKRGARDGPWTKWTWNDYYAEVQKVARALMALGCEQYQASNILGFNSPEWFFAAIGSVFAGLTPSGIYSTNGPDGVEYIIGHSKCRVMFVDSDPQLQKVLSVRSKHPQLITIVHWGNDCTADGSVPGVMSWKKFITHADGTPQASLDARVSNMHPDNACYLSYTSGTTGQPKAVMYSHDNLTWGLKKLIDIWVHGADGFGLEEREISYMPLSHIAGNVQLLGNITMGPKSNSTVYFAFPDAMQGSLPDTIRDVQPTHFLGVPRVYEKLAMGMQQLLKAKPDLQANPAAVKSLLGLEKVRVSTTGAAPIAKETMEFYDSIGMPLLEVYGMTENTAYSHYNQKGKRQIGSVGPALTHEGAGAKIDENTGEICTWSRGLMMGYMYMPEKTADTFDDEGFLKTGDIGEVRDGFTYITGRIKEMIITGGGENCAPVLLENAIKERLPALSNVVMIGDKQKYLIVLMTLKLEPNATGGFTEKLTAEATAVDRDCKTFADAMKSSKWKAYLDKGIEEANKAAISRAQQTRKFVVIPGDFSPVGETPELTPTMKLRREVFHKKYLDVIKNTYGEDFIPF